MQVDFYQLSRDPVEQALPGIARRVLEEGGRLLVVSDDPAQLERISRGLWDAGPDTYLAHDRAVERSFGSRRGFGCTVPFARARQGRCQDRRAAESRSRRRGVAFTYSGTFTRWHRG